MDSFTPLERTALDAILNEMADGRATVEAQLLHAKILLRENTGGGFFVTLGGDDQVERLEKRRAPLGQNVWLGRGAGIWPRGNSPLRRWSGQPP